RPADRHGQIPPEPGARCAPGRHGRGRSRSPRRGATGMTDLDLFEQQLASRLRTLAPEPGPGLLDHVRVALDATPQRAAGWAAGPLFQSRVRSSGRGRWSLAGLIVALL